MKHLLCSASLVFALGSFGQTDSGTFQQTSDLNYNGQHVEKLATLKDWRVVGDIITAESAFVVEQSSPVELAGDWRVVGGTQGA